MAEPATSPNPVLQPPPAYRTDGKPPAPRKPYVPPSFKPKRKRRSCCRCCFCCCCPIMILLLFILAIAASAFYLFYEPKLPNYHLQSFKFPHFNVTTKKDGTFLDYQMEAKFRAVNPNTKITIAYDQIDSTLSMGQDEDETELGTVSVPAFTQGTKNATLLKFDTGLKRLLIDDDSAPRLKSQFKSKAIVVNMEVKTKVVIGIDTLKLGKLPVKVVCGGIAMKDLEGDYSPKCTVNLFNLINIH